jgi:thymidine kinase
MADEKIVLTADCDGEGRKCRAPAEFSYRKKPSKKRVVVAGADKYGAACEKHYQELHQNI